MRVLLYVRYSTDKQDALSIATQLMMCRREIERQGWTEVGVFTDDAKSAATLHRPGMQAMLAALDRCVADVMMADAMDRIARGQSGISIVFDRLKFRGQCIVTLKEGELTPLHIGMVGTINAEQLRATSDKTRDALVHRHATGKNPGGVAYGYEKRVEHEVNGERIKGPQQIVPAQVATIVRICQDYAADTAPGRIMRRLNEEGVPPPRSGKRDKKLSKKPSAWSPNTITGNAERGTGILNNILYIGRRPYLTQTYRKNPDTGKRHGFLVAADQRAGLV